MPHVVSGICFHIVFPTRGNTPLLTGSFAKELQDHLGEVVRGLDSELLAVGGMPDHLHMLAHIGPTTGLSRFVERVKLRATYWAHISFPGKPLIEWDPGYCAFTVTAQQTKRVTEYVKAQGEHHRAMSYQEELHRLRKSVRHDFKTFNYS